MAIDVLITRHVIANPLRRWRRVTGLLTWCTTACILGGVDAAAQQADQLFEQLQALKREYAETTRTLEQRIAVLEQQIQKQKEETEKTKQATVSATELAAEKAAQNAVLGESNQVGAKYQGQLPSEPTYDLLREADTKIEKLEEEVRGFEFHGYLRSGYGLNSKGTNKLHSKLQEQMQSTVWEMRPKRMRNSFLSTTG